MAAQYLTGWNPLAIVAAHTSLLALLDAQTGAASVTIHSSTDALLAQIDLTDPCGSVNGTNGVLTLTPNGREEAAPAGGAASYASIRDGAGTVMRSVPCQQGLTPVAGYCVMSNLLIVSGEPVEILSITVQ